jgi:chromosome partitioning protein
MARIITLANQKGGVAKTSSCINLGAALAEQQQRVLLVDLDPQSSLTAALGINPAALPLSIYNVMVTRQPIRAIIQPSGRLYVAPATIDLAAAEAHLVNEVSREHVLGDALADIAEAYDFILIDCPPSLGQLTINGLSCADEVLIPITCHYLALRGLEQLMDSIEKVQRRANRRLRLLGVLPTMVEGRTVHEQEVLEELHARFPGQVFEPVRKSIRFPESTVAGKPLLDYDPAHPGSEAYRSLAREVLRAA